MSSKLSRPNPLLQAHWTGEYWILDVEEAVPMHCLRAAADYLFKVNQDRWLSLPHGDKRERWGVALQALKDGKIQQRIAKKAGDTVLFKSTEGTGKIIVPMGG